METSIDNIRKDKRENKGGGGGEEEEEKNHNNNNKRSNVYNGTLAKAGHYSIRF